MILFLAIISVSAPDMDTFVGRTFTSTKVGFLYPNQSGVGNKCPFGLKVESEFFVQTECMNPNVCLDERKTNSTDF